MVQTQWPSHPNHSYLMRLPLNEKLLIFGSQSCIMRPIHFQLSRNLVQYPITFKSDLCIPSVSEENLPLKCKAYMTASQAISREVHIMWHYDTWPFLETRCWGHLQSRGTFLTRHPRSSLESPSKIVFLAHSSNICCLALQRCLRNSSALPLGRFPHPDHCLLTPICH